jgi:hypothetical protein
MLANERASPIGTNYTYYFTVHNLQTTNNFLRHDRQPAHVGANVGAPLVGAPGPNTLSGPGPLGGHEARPYGRRKRRVRQRNYEHVIRDERDLARVRRYIDENPLRWEFDQDNPQRKTS